mgnify:CR=1 FL=1
MMLMIKEISWHSGAGVLTSTLGQAYGDIIDTMFVVFIILMGVAKIVYKYIKEKAVWPRF